MLYEYRSEDADTLRKMEAFFLAQTERIRAERQARITVERVGERPCGRNVDAARLAALTERAVRICEKHAGGAPAGQSGSTDCNRPMSLGIPAISVGTYLGGGEHTREERVRIDSIPTGLRIAAELILGYFTE